MWVHPVWAKSREEGKAQKDSDIVSCTFFSARVPKPLTNEIDNGGDYSWKPSPHACGMWAIWCRVLRKRDWVSKQALSQLICETVNESGEICMTLDLIYRKGFEEDSSQ